MGNVPRLQSKGLRASVSRTVNLIAPTFRFKAGRFLRWRKRRSRKTVLSSRPG